MTEDELNEYLKLAHPRLYLYRNRPAQKLRKAIPVPIFFVSGDEYPVLQSACPGEFPRTYEQFVTGVEKGIRGMALTMTGVKVTVCVTDFLGWCYASRVKPDSRARAAYAAQIYMHGLQSNTEG